MKFDFGLLLTTFNWYLVFLIALASIFIIACFWEFRVEIADWAGKRLRQVKNLFSYPLCDLNFLDDPHTNLEKDFQKIQIHPSTEACKLCYFWKKPESFCKEIAGCTAKPNMPSIFIKKVK